MKNYFVCRIDKFVMTIAGEEGKITDVVFGKREFLNCEMRRTEIIKECAAQLKEYFVGKRKEFDLPLSLPLAGFRGDVIRALTKVKYGETVSYSELAALSGHKGACRAVGSVMNKNPIAVLVPCHRVICENKRVGGYAYGSDLKKYLLDLEKLPTKVESKEKIC